jgi:hypothetical protein
MFFTGNKYWDDACSAVVRCYGANLPTGGRVNGDCNLAGADVCASAVNRSSGWSGAYSCSLVANPPRTPCDAAAMVLQCLREHCNTHCKL